MHLIPGDPDEGVDGVKMMPLQICHDFLFSHLLAFFAPSRGEMTSLMGLSPRPISFRVSSQTLLGMRRVAVLPPEGFSGLD